MTAVNLTLENLCYLAGTGADASRFLIDRGGDAREFPWHAPHQASARQSRHLVGLAQWLFLTSAVAPNASAPPSASSVTNGNCVANAPVPNASAPLAVEVTDKYGPYRGDHEVMVSDSRGLPLVTFACTGPHESP